MTADLPHVIVYDGDCSFCSRLIRLMDRFDSSGLRIVGSQTQAGQLLLERAGVEGAVVNKTVVVIRAERAWFRSDAVLVAASRVTRFAVLGYAVPRVVRDGIYGVVSRNRHRLSAGGSACGIPDETVRVRLARREVTADEVRAGTV